MPESFLRTFARERRTGTVSFNVGAGTPTSLEVRERLVLQDAAPATR